MLSRAILGDIFINVHLAPSSRLDVRLRSDHVKVPRADMQTQTQKRHELRLTCSEELNGARLRASRLSPFGAPLSVNEWRTRETHRPRLARPQVVRASRGKTEDVEGTSPADAGSRPVIGLSGRVSLAGAHCPWSAGSPDCY